MYVGWRGLAAMDLTCGSQNIFNICYANSEKIERGYQGFVCWNRLYVGKQFITHKAVQTAGKRGLVSNGPAVLH